MNEVTAIRPAMEILRELDEGRFLDKLALAFHEATDGVRALGKTAKISIAIDIAPFKAQLVEPVITMEVEITTKLPRPDASRALFYIDVNGNPVTQQQRQRGLDLQVAARTQPEAAKGAA
jgi:hypothetical protein